MAAAHLQVSEQQTPTAKGGYGLYILHTKGLSVVL